MRAVLDADVLYPLPLRDTLLSIAEAGGFQPVWSGQILDEAFQNLVADERMTSSTAGKTRAAMTNAFPDAMTVGHERLIDQMPNHPKDRHVAACAVAANAATIVTSNGKDFKYLPTGIVAVSPDDFLLGLLDESPATVKDGLDQQASRTKRRPMTVDEILDLLILTTPRFVTAYRAVIVE